MTAINDDVGAVFIYSLFLFYGVRVIKKDFSPESRGTFTCLASMLLNEKQPVRLYSDAACYSSRHTWATPEGLLWTLVIGSALVGLSLHSAGRCAVLV